MIFRILFLIAAGLLVMLNSSMASDDKESLLSKTFVVEGDHFYPPYEFINEQGQPDGFNIELFRALADELGINYQIQLKSWKDVWHDIENQQADIILGMMVSEQRHDKVLFGIPHSIMTHGIFVRKGSPVKSIDDLTGKAVIVQNFDRMHEYVLEKKLTDQIIPVESQLEALKLLSLGKYDAVLLGNFQGEYLLDKHQIKNVKLRTSNIEPQKYAMAVSRHNEELLSLLNAGLYQLKSSGEYDRIYEKWFSVHEKKQLLHRYKYLWLILGPSIFFLGIFIVLLRLQVNRTTRKLKESNQASLKLVDDLQKKITFRKKMEKAFFQNERKFREIFNSTTEAILVQDINSGQIADCNNRTIEMYGFDSKEELFLCTFGDLIAETDDFSRELATENIELAKKMGSSTFECPAKRKDNQHFWVEVSFKHAEIGEEEIILAVVRDISERKKAEKELLEAKEHAEESDRLKSAFLANISHEIRTPLNSIMGFASMLPEEDSKELMAEYASIIVSNSEQLVSLIDGIVIYSKLQTGQMNIRKTSFSIGNMFEDIQRSFSLPEYQKGIQLIMDDQSGNIDTITTDYDKLRQVFNNLITNAFKYTNEGSIHFGYHTSGQQFTFYVRDTGIGIPPEDQPHIFERFFRGKNIDQTYDRGTGLGLSIVKELVELLGGNIILESELGKGTLFQFNLPVTFMKEFDDHK